MILSKILLLAGILAVARPRPFVHTIGALGEIRALRGFDFSFFRACSLVQAAGGFFALFGRCVLNGHEILRSGWNAVPTNGHRMINVPIRLTEERPICRPRKARAS
jgi:hypothetical protein